MLVSTAWGWNLHSLAMPGSFGVAVGRDFPTGRLVVPILSFPLSWCGRRTGSSLTFSASPYRREAVSSWTPIASSCGKEAFPGWTSLALSCYGWTSLEEAWVSFPLTSNKKGISSQVSLASLCDWETPLDQPFGSEQRLGWVVFILLRNKQVIGVNDEELTKKG